MICGKTSALHVNLCNFMILYYYSFPHLLLLVKNWAGCTERIHRMLLSLQTGVGVEAGWCCTHIGNNDHLMHRLHKNYEALQSLFQTFQRVCCSADSSLNPTVLQHFNEIRTWHKKLMWISRYLSSISNIKDVLLSFYFFLKVLFIWTHRDNVQLHHMLLSSHFEFWHWITNSSWSIIGSCGFTYSHRSISIFLSLLYQIHAYTMLTVSAPTASSPMAQSVNCHNLVILFIHTTHYSFENTPEVVKPPLS